MPILIEELKNKRGEVINSLATIAAAVPSIAYEIIVQLKPYFHEEETVQALRLINTKAPKAFFKALPLFLEYITRKDKDDHMRKHTIQTLQATAATVPISSANLTMLLFLTLCDFINPYFADDDGGSDKCSVTCESWE